MKWFRWWWLLLLIPVAIGVARLRFDAEILDLLPHNIRAIAGLKIFQQHFTTARELIITVRGNDADAVRFAAQRIAEHLRTETNLISEVTWRPPWIEHPGQTAELIAFLWLNQPPEIFNDLASRLAETNLAGVLALTREQLATTLSPTDLAQASYDPFGFTHLPENLTGAAAGFGQGEQLFASADGTFRIIFVKSRRELGDYRECTDWFNAVKNSVNTLRPAGGAIKIGYTGRPAFVAEISASMKHDIILSVGGTTVIIAILFWLAHHRWKPMLWLLTLLAVILASTLGLGGLIFGTVSVISMGFAAILLGLAVDYAVVHYQEALARPEPSIPEIRRAIAPGILWAAVTTISAFLALNFSGLPGLAQLGSLVGIGVALSASVMIFAFLPPLFPDRMRPKDGRDTPIPVRVGPANEPAPFHRLRATITFEATLALILFCAGILSSGLPKLDPTSNVVKPRNSQAYATLDDMKENLSQKREPLFLIISGRDENEVADRLQAVEPALKNAVANGTLAGFTLPTMLWPRSEYQANNRSAMQALINRREAMRSAVLSNGFSGEAMGLAEGVLDTWQRAVATTNVFWPTNQLSKWILEKFAAHTPDGFFAVGFLLPSTDVAAANYASFAELDSELPHDRVWLAGWELLAGTVLAEVQKNLWKLLLPMVGLILLSLGLAFRRFVEIFLSLGVLLLGGLCLLATMIICGWSWNLLNLMALPLILGTGVDYSIFMQLALRRHGGDLGLARRSVGRALLLCGGTAIAGFGSLGFSSNAGMASLGQVCAVAIGCNMLISVYLLPVWWRGLDSTQKSENSPPGPSTSYRASVWRLGMLAVKVLPETVCRRISLIGAGFYRWTCPRRCEIVIQNLLPIFHGNRAAAVRTTRKLFAEFTLKLVDLWRYEGGAATSNWFVDWTGWEIFTAAQARGRGVLFVTPHLGNWELGGPFMVSRGCKLLVLTQDEPDPRLTAMRQASRARWGVDTLVVGNDAFAILEIIKRLQAGTTVALLMDRPPQPTAVTVDLFGRKFPASIAAAELARASGCAIVPTFIVREPDGYHAQLLPEIDYDRALLDGRDARIQLTQKIVRVFEPAIRQYAAQWYHFVPLWPETGEHGDRTSSTNNPASNR